MPSFKGKVRRPNVGKLQTRTTSISFSKEDYLWLSEQSSARNISQSLVIADALACYREQQALEMRKIELEEKRAKRAARDMASSEHTPAPVEL